MLTIEQGIPLPPKQVIIRQCKYPIKQLKAGDSFFVPLTNHSLNRTIMNVRSLIKWHTSKHRGRFEVRPIYNETETPPSPTGVRVWRIK